MGAGARRPADVEDACSVSVDLAFLADWEKGLIPDLYAFLRVRQIRRSTVLITARHGAPTNARQADDASRVQAL